MRECDLARRMVHYAVRQGIPPKHVNDDFVLLRDAKVLEHGHERLDELAAHIRDHNFRLFFEGGLLHVITAGAHLTGTDPFHLFDQLRATQPKHLDPSHAFYLGYELCKAATALALGKQYEQDVALNWGFLTVPETSHRLARERDA